MSRLDFLDAGRGIAILGVIAVHTVQHFSTGIRTFDFVISLGQFGVQLFFMISAYTMMHTLTERVNTEKHSIKNFWIRRFFRIAIPFWVGIVVYQYFRLAHVEYYVSNSGDWLSIILSFLLIQGFWPNSLNSIVPGGWSIATEVIFYMIFPVIFSMKGNVLKISLFGLIVIILDRIVIRPAYLWVFSLFNMNINQVDITSSFFYYYIFNQFPVFLFGVFIYILSNDKRCSGFSKAEVIALLLFLLGFIIASPKLTIISFIGSLFLLTMKKLRFHPYWLIWVGRQSYSLYLFHFAVLNLMLMFWHRPNQDSIAVFIFGYILAVFGAITIGLATKPLLEDVGSSVGRFIVNINEKKQT